MSRALRYKIIYILLIAISIFIGIFLSIQFSNNLFAFLTIPILLLVPGRLQGHLYRAHFKGRKLLVHRQYNQALKEFQTFLVKLDQKPWLKHAIWLGGFVYTKDIKAMTLNNAGVCSLELGELEDSKSYLESALLLDNKYAVPYFNLSIINELEGDHLLAISNFNTSVELGYSSNSIDYVLIKAQEIYARMEGGKINKI